MPPPAPPGTYHDNGWGIELRGGLHAAGRRFRLDVRRRLRRHQRRLHDARRPRPAGVTGTTSSAPGPPRAAEIPRWKMRHERRPVHPALREPAGPGRHLDVDTLDAQHAADAVDRRPHPTLSRSCPPPPRAPAAGTPVTIEGNYFDTSPTPQVFFGGVAATNVHVELGRRAERGRTGGPGRHGDGSGRRHGFDTGRLVQC